ncbi:MAG: KamA family radical SAM protein [Leptospiraceae bacterium]|nr:KamA family radical SAM protein [Leptospiraceae bacterium]MCK6381017.1 KamA family radical SAM protein [Leptospiraceae bacterium]NUM41415.1 KamA family radical SAM protein [Leptospiraceae bacterium]
MGNLPKHRKEESLENWSDWKWQLQNRIRTLDDLEKWVSLSNEEKKIFSKAKENFDFAVSPYYLSLVQPKNKNCPIRKQIIPNKGELLREKFETEDPLGEEAHSPVKGVTHRYPDRALWYLSHNCPVYCRFCTRKRKVSKSTQTPGFSDWDCALQYFRKEKKIREVILSGGDPLSLSDNQLNYILEKLKSISHINQVRIHTRYPVTLPMRINDALCDILSKYFPLFIVTHFNHKNECTESSRLAVKNLITKGHATVLNQSVLLKGVNDSEKSLVELLYTLTGMGIKPYYLHQCDEVFGSSHFKVPISKGQKLMKKIRGYVSGISVPVYTADLTGGGGKIPIPTNYLVNEDKEFYIFSNYRGKKYKIKK